jgi:hypothetical protein
MSAWAIGLITFASAYGGALLGLALQRVLPEHHLSLDSKDVVKLVAGLLATLSALVLGLLIASSKGSFDAVNDGLKHSAAKVIVADRLLAQYGPEAKGVREQLKRAYAERVARLFPEGGRDGKAGGALGEASSLEGIQGSLRTLVPATDAQRALLSRVQQVADDVVDARWLGFEQATNSTPPAFLAVLVSWLAVMFGSFGLFAPRNATALVALAAGALAVAAAIFLIEEMNHPLDGVISIPSAPLRDTLTVLGK